MAAHLASYRNIPKNAYIRFFKKNALYGCGQENTNKPRFGILFARTVRQELARTAVAMGRRLLTTKPRFGKKENETAKTQTLRPAVPVWVFFQPLGYCLEPHLDWSGQEAMENQRLSSQENLMFRSHKSKNRTKNYDLVPKASENKGCWWSFGAWPKPSWIFPKGLLVMLSNPSHPRNRSQKRPTNVEGRHPIKTKKCNKWFFFHQPSFFGRIFQVCVIWL